jgi:nucleoside-diphosphate-sugar epimerase
MIKFSYRFHKRAINRERTTMNTIPKNILIVGGAGYIGQIVSEKLLKEGFSVTIFDLFIHGHQEFKQLLPHPNFRSIKGDMNHTSSLFSLMDNFDAVILLAAIVGEAACDKDPELTTKTNLISPGAIWEYTSKKENLKRVIFTSTDSCYGQRPQEKLYESSILKPLSTYAKYKADIEKVFLAPKDKEHKGPIPIVLRLATVYGLAPRMRFDLAVNLLSREATLKRKFKIFSGEQWRPLVHVRDVAEAFHLALTAPHKKVKGEVFNVGSNAQNIKFVDLGNIIASTLNAQMEIVPGSPDLRDYYVNFDKIAKELGFKAKVSIKEGIEEIREALLKGVFPDPYDVIYRNA